ncbi:hypothetical protein A3K63_02145 [Candidatus Micrarchaeota archaeon RBG_16_49_10]|nr:MAG: hypothetical protein A3K63_02145 [Candidatus Micrarchaeota archaeon RBG_16_49_10]
MGNLTLNLDVDYLYSAVIDPSNGFAYFGTAESPDLCQIIKINLTDFTRVGNLTLNSDEGDLESAVLDPSNGFAYFGTYTTSGQIIKINLTDFTRVGNLTLNSDEGDLESAVIDPSNGFAYFGTSSSPDKIIKINLTDFTRVGNLTFNPSEYESQTAVIDPSNGFAYFGTSSSPNQIIKINLTDFTRVGNLTLNEYGGSPRPAVIDPSNGFAYFSATNTNPSQIIKINLTDFTRVGNLTLNAGEGPLYSAVIDPSNGFAYFGTYTSSNSQIIKAQLSQKNTIKTIKINVTETAYVDNISFYSHLNTSQVRLAVYNSTKHLLWESNSTENTVLNGWLNISISDGTPSSLTLSSGTYYLAYQINTTSSVPSYLQGSFNDGFYLEQPYQSFPASILSENTTSEVWSMFLTYETTAPTTTTTSTTTVSSGGGGGGGEGSSGLSKLWSTVLANAEYYWNIADAQLRVTQINFTSTVQRSNVRLNAQRLTSKPANISQNLSGVAYQYVEITKSNIQDSEIKDAKIRFKVQKSWLTSNNLQTSDIKMARYSGGWADLQIQKTGEDTSWVFYTSPTPGFSTFAIYAGTSGTTTTTTTTPAGTTTPGEATSTTQPVVVGEGDMSKLLLIMGVVFLILVGVLVALTVISKNSKRDKDNPAEDEFEQLEMKWASPPKKSKMDKARTAEDEFEQMKRKWTPTPKNSKKDKGNLNVDDFEQLKRKWSKTQKDTIQ